MEFFLFLPDMPKLIEIIILGFSVYGLRFKKYSRHNPK